MPTPDVPTVLVVFGSTGDLMQRKIVPALFHLFEHGRLPERFCLLGYGRRPLSQDDFRQHVTSILEQQRDLSKVAEKFDAFLGMFRYQHGTFAESADYAALADRLRTIDDEWGTCANKLFYLAVPPEHYRTIFGHLADSGLTVPCSETEGWTRVLVEKPFGKDARSAQELDELLGSLFKEEQIYRIDHYLAKEMLQGIMTFRFSNNLLEPSWDRRAIERIDVNLLESIDVGGRGAFYDGVGALRDVGQNHLLQMIALVTMDQPMDASAEAIRASRVQAIRCLRRPKRRDAACHAWRAQYEGYRDTEGVAPDSATETYFRLEATLGSDRWRDVPVTMQAGKAFDKPRKDIVVTFRHAEPCLCPGVGDPRNRVVFEMEPADSIRIGFWTKAPGLEDRLEERDFTFMLYEREEKAQYVEEYSKLLLDAIHGDQTLFVSTEEVRAMWEFVDPVYEAFEADLLPLEEYAHGADGAVVEERAAHETMLRSCVPAPKRGIAVLGLGKMGGNLSRNLMRHGWRVVGFNRSPGKTKTLAEEGIVPAFSLAEVVAELPAPRVLWLMLPAGPTVDAVLFGPQGVPPDVTLEMSAETREAIGEGLIALLEPGDIVIEGGNSYYEDAVRRAARFEGTGVEFIDVGVSGGPGGALRGACLMVGGHAEVYERLVQLWRAVSVENGYRHFEGYGAGHFVKMVHNGIEYGMMHAIAEGFSVLAASDYDLDLVSVADVYQHGSVVESRLVGWLEEALEIHGREMTDVSPVVGHTGEGEWTVRTAERLGVDATVIAHALEFRRLSSENQTYAGRLLTGMRNRFGGHSIGG